MDGAEPSALVRAQSELGHAIFRLREHEFNLATQAALSGHELFNAADNPSGAALCQCVGAIALIQQGGTEQAGDLLSQAAEIARRTDDQGLLATCLEVDADRVSFAGDGDHARRLMQRAREIYLAREDSAGVVRTTATLSELTFMVGSDGPAIRLLVSLEAGMHSMTGTPDDELLGRFAGARACAYAARADIDSAVGQFAVAGQHLDKSSVPCVIGRIAANVAHLLARGQAFRQAGQVLDTAIVVLRRHGNTALEYKLAAARAVHAVGGGEFDQAEGALDRALALSEARRDDERRLAMLNLGIEIAALREDVERGAEHRLALARLLREQGFVEDAVGMLLDAAAVLGEDGRGAPVAEISDILRAVPMNSHPFTWFLTTVDALANLGELDLTADLLAARTGSERGPELARLQAASGEVAFMRGDIQEADRLFFEAIHSAGLHGLAERERWIERHLQITAG